MLIAKNQEGNLVSALETCLKRKESYSCPGCQGVVLLRHGQVMCPHFAHKSLQDCQFFSENESAQHLSLKAALYKSLVNHGEKRLFKETVLFGQRGAGTIEAVLYVRLTKDLGVVIDLAQDAALA